MLLVVLPTLIACTLLCVYCLRVLEQTIIDDSTAIAVAVEKNINGHLKGLSYFIRSIKVSGTNSNLKQMEGTLESATEEMYRLSVRIKDYRGTNALARKIYVYYPGIDYIISDDGCYPSSSYYVLQSPPYREGYAEWKDFLLQEHLGELAMVDLPDGRRLCYIDQVRIEGRTRAVMVVEINYDTLCDVLASYDTPGKRAACLMLHGELVLSVGDEEMIGEVTRSGLELSTMHSGERIGQNYVFYNSSQFENFGYLAIYTSQGLLHSMLVVSRVCYGTLTGCVVLLVALSFLFGKRQSAAMRNLIHKVNDGDGFPATEDEYLFVSKKIDKMIADKYKTEQQIAEYQSQLNSLFLANVLQNPGRSEQELFLIAEKYSVSFEYSQYRVAVLSGEMELRQVQSVCHRLQTLGNGGAGSCIVSYDTNSYFILLNFDNADDEADVLLVKQFMDCAFPDEPARAGIGLCYDSTSRIQDSYRQAMAALEPLESCLSHPIRLFNLAEWARRPQTDERRGKSSANPKREVLIAEQAKAFVDENFCDPMMGLYYVAAKLEVGNSYLSTAFKNRYTVGIIQYINTLRIEKAKEYILKTDLNIKQIAQLVGFSSDISFIRVFKKYANTTPSSLRVASGGSAGEGEN